MSIFLVCRQNGSQTVKNFDCYSKFLISHLRGRTTCRSVISIKLKNIFIEIALRHGCSPVNLLHIFRTPFLKNTSWRLLLKDLLIGNAQFIFLYNRQKSSTSLACITFLQTTQKILVKYIFTGWNWLLKFRAFYQYSV